MAELELDDELEDSSSMRDLRNHAKAMERKVKQLEKENEDLKVYRDEAEDQKKFSESQKVFEELGLSAKHAALFRAVNPDAVVDEEAVKAFASDYDIQVISKEDIDAPLSDPLARNDAGFKPVVSGQPTGRKRYDGVEWWDLYRENPGAALNAVKEGRVDLLTELPK